MRALYFHILLAIVSLSVFAQEETKTVPKIKKILPVVSFRLAGFIPKNTASEAFCMSFTGVYDANFSCNVRLFNNFCVGVGYGNSLWNPADYFKHVKVVATSTAVGQSAYGLGTKMQVHQGYVRLGYDHFATEKIFWSFSLNSGYGFNQYTDVRCADSLVGKLPTSFIAFFIRPEVAVNFLVDENFAFGIHLAYNHNFYTYDPSLNCFDNYADKGVSGQSIKYGDATYENKTNIGWFSFGFGFYYGFKKKKA